jgi:von Willebrand factor type A domain
MKYRWVVLALTLSCTSPNPALLHENCGAQVSCPTGGASYRACASRDGSACSFVGSDSRTFTCVSCDDCVAAAGEVTRWCNSGGGTTGGGTTGGGTTGGGTTGGGTTGGGTTGGGTTGGGTSGGTTGGPAVACPSVLVILDRSASMDGDPAGTGSGGTSKLEIAKAAIKTLMQQHADHFAFGLEVFTDEAVSPMCDAGVDVLVSPAFGTGATIQTQVSSVITGGTTNTGAALAKANTLTPLNDGTRPTRSIILLTDGAPNCLNTPDDLSGAVTQVQTSVSKGILTFVVGLGVLVDPDKSGIDQIAAADPSASCSGASCGGNHYYPALDTASLATFLGNIAARLDNGACNR